MLVGDQGKYMRIFKIVMRGMISLAIICSVYLCGVYSTKYQQNIEKNKSTIMTT